MNRTPAVAYELWNPNAAAKWGFLFSPAFGAWLHATNWREIGEPRLARANMMWVWVTIAFLALNAATVFVHLPRIADALTRLLGLLLWAGWYFTLGRKQVEYVNDYGGHYVKKRWLRPLIAAVLAIALYFLAICALVYAMIPSPPKVREPAALAAWVEPRILGKWHENATLKDATIQSVVIDHKDGNTYSGVVDATLGGKPERLGLVLTVTNDSFSWKLNVLKSGDSNRK